MSVGSSHTETQAVLCPTLMQSKRKRTDTQTRMDRYKDEVGEARHGWACDTRHLHLMLHAASEEQLPASNSPRTYRSHTRGIMWQPRAMCTLNNTSLKASKLQQPQPSRSYWVASKQPPINKNQKSKQKRKGFCSIECFFYTKKPFTTRQCIYTVGSVDDLRGVRCALSFTILSTLDVYQNEQTPEIIKQSLPPKTLNGRRKRTQNFVAKIKRYPATKSMPRNMTSFLFSKTWLRLFL